MIKTTLLGSPEKRNDGSLIYPKWERAIAVPLGLQIVGYDMNDSTWWIGWLQINP